MANRVKGKNKRTEAAGGEASAHANGDASVLAVVGARGNERLAGEVAAQLDMRKGRG